MQMLFTARRVSCVVPSAQSDRTIFEDLSFDVDRGQIVDLVGPSGSGKSSLLTAFALLNPHADGTFTLDGADSSSFSLQQWRRNVASAAEAHADGRQRRRHDSASLDAGRAQSGRGECARRPCGHRQEDFRETRQVQPAVPLRTVAGEAGATRPAHSQYVGRHGMRGYRPGPCAARPFRRSGGPRQPREDAADPPGRAAGRQVDAGLDDDNADKVASIMASAAARGMAIVRIRHRPPDGRATRIVTLSSGRLS